MLAKRSGTSPFSDYLGFQSNAKCMDEHVEKDDRDDEGFERMSIPAAWSKSSKFCFGFWIHCLTVPVRTSSWHARLGHLKACLSYDSSEIDKQKSRTHSWGSLGWLSGRRDQCKKNWAVVGFP